ncbi:sensor histidine kinase [Arenibaculum sp.]|jgi:two-component sensor histidine kinase|uniref:sensor histidine kinase n=1 Tax=Arenibaculum sp. TaxID=2865862 RepID=UPI002E162CCE|nr:histidine kinase dimerization/phosphoacceptor domain -containing protein [Arenibaculum sp.]
MRILIVDDDPDARTLAVRALRQELADPEIREVGSAADLDLALAEGVPDILVTDYDLRWSDGLRVLERVEAGQPLAAAVMFTGTGNEELAVRAMKGGFDDYVVKGPKQFRRLATSVRIAWERALERRELSENRNLVLKELYHRLHNNLQIVISLMGLTARAVSADSREQILDLSRRIQALSSLQEQFYRSPDFRRVDFTAYLDRLTRDLIGLGGGRIVLDTRFDALELPVDVAVPLGLIANELIMGALKHGYAGERTGRMEVRLQHGEDGVVLALADDDGTGFQEGGDTPGLGMELVRRLAAQLRAELVFVPGAAGTECRLTFKP